MRIASSQHANPDNDCDWVRFVTRPQQISRDEAKKKVNWQKRSQTVWGTAGAREMAFSFISQCVPIFSPSVSDKHTHTHTCWTETACSLETAIILDFVFMTNAIYNMLKVHELAGSNSSSRQRRRCKNLDRLSVCLSRSSIRFFLKRTVPVS